MKGKKRTFRFVFIFMEGIGELANPENLRDRVLFSKICMNILRMFFCRGYADIKPSDLIVK